MGFSINGQRESGTEILLDGVENIAVFGVAVGEDVPMDAVQEYSVITNNFSAEYGRASGGVVNLTTKSGTNSLPWFSMGVQPSLGLHRQYLRQRCSQYGCGFDRIPQGNIHPKSVRLPGRWSNPQEQALHF